MGQQAEDEAEGEQDERDRPGPHQRGPRPLLVRWADSQFGPETAPVTALEALGRWVGSGYHAAMLCRR